MPLIEPKLSWPYKGHNYNTEIEAVRVAIDDMGKRLVKDFSANPGKGLMENRELSRFLCRYHELARNAEVTSPQVTEGTRSEELEGTQKSDPFDRAFDLPEVEEIEEAA